MPLDLELDIVVNSVFTDMIIKQIAACIAGLIEVEMANWKQKLTEVLERNGERWSDIQCIEVYINISPYYADCQLDSFKDKYTKEHIEDMSVDAKMSVEFYDGYKTGACPIQFQAWTKENIYFSHEYDGSDTVMSKRRNLPNAFRPHNRNNVYYKPLKFDYEEGE